MYEMEMNQDFKDIMRIQVSSVSDRTPICPFILGEPGIGKSSVVRAMCEENGWHFFELLCNQLGDRADLTGCRSVKTTENVSGKDEEIWKQVFFPHQSIQDAITCAKNNPDDIVVLFLDEINRTSSDITSAILSFTTARKIGTYEFPPNVRFVVAGNDKGNVVALDSASISRFFKIKLRPSAATYMGIEGQLNPYVKQVLTQNPGFIFGKGAPIVTSQVSDGDDGNFTNEYEAFDEASGFEQITTPRTISGLNAFLNACSDAMLNHYATAIAKDAETGEEVSMLQTIVQGHVGNTPFANELCKVISTAVSSGLMQQANNVVAPTRPAVYNQIKRCADRQTRDSMIARLSDREKSEIILYACYEKGVNNADLINAVMTHFSGNVLSDGLSPQFCNLKSHDQLDPDNYAALIATGTTLAVTMKAMLGD